MNFLKNLFRFNALSNKYLKPIIETGKKQQQESLINISVLEDLKKQCIYPTSYSNENDVFIASYPKSGTTWLRHLSTSLIYGMDASLVPDILVNLLFPDLHAFKYYFRSGRPVLYKTHDLPAPKMKKVVHLVRDVRDIYFSYYSMLKMHGYEISLDEMIDRGTGMFPCDWSTHCSEWVKNPYNAEILRISYEDLKEKPLLVLKKYCNFVGIETDENRIKKAISQTEFSKMQNKERKQGMGQKKINANELFFRKGVVGTHLSELTSDQIDIVVTRNNIMLKKLGYI